ncbi:MAG: Nramp family divalent metal transporter [Gemmataceae bacterium]|nr:Nramp family divalent metal transporter [Gemmataceae bacterium]
MNEPTMSDATPPPPGEPGTSRSGTLSLEGLNSTVPIPPETAGFWKQYRAFVGPAFLVSVGYMDPGNWGTDLDAGAKYKFDLLWVVALSSFMAIVMQVCSARLGIVTGKDLAQACRDHLPGWTRYPNWVACELAIAACDLAEVLGSAVALNLLFGIPIFWAVLITALDVLLILALQGFGVRFIEAVILTLVATIGGCYFVEIFVLPQTTPNFLEMGSALLSPGFRQEGMVVGAIGIIGATVMPHNLYLHSALVRTRQLGTDESALRRAIKFNTLDTVGALSLAFFVNAAILVLAATTFYGREGATLASGEVVSFGEDADWIRVAYLTLTPLLGASAASALFAVALLASGQSSTITGTLAGQVVMEGFLHWRTSPWVRRIITRLLAIVPAVVVIGARGGGSVTDLLVLSQVVLAMQLPLAMFPLLYFTSSKRIMGDFRNGWFLLAVGWASCLLITALDLYGLPGSLEKAWVVIVGKAE